MDRMPAVFLGHGSPMNAITRNQYTQAWSTLGQRLPRPKAVLCISAHWYVPGTGVTISTAPRTIHDFGGFPPELYQVRYPAPGDPVLARRVQQLLAPLPVALDDRWGLDHGTWSVLRHVYPEADVPIVQLSIDRTQAAAVHYGLGERLAPLRDEDVLIAGSGNLVHNLQAYNWSPGADPFDWAARFEEQARQIIQAGDPTPLIQYGKLGRDALLSVPTPDHYLPFLYVIGVRQNDDAVTFPVEGIDGGSVSMLAVEVARNVRSAG
jgi:4,5-DOPA dioxygenase extradiol